MNELRFNFSCHARERIKQKSISEFEVKETVLNLDRWYYGEYGELNTIKNFGIKKIRIHYIIVKGKNFSFFVIPAYAGIS